jgi:hypothetical protein
VHEDIPDVAEATEAAEEDAHEVVMSLVKDLLRASRSAKESLMA